MTLSLGTYYRPAGGKLNKLDIKFKINLNNFPCVSTVNKFHASCADASLNSKLAGRW